MTEGVLLDAREFDRDDNLAAATIVALDRLNLPDLRVKTQQLQGRDHGSRCQGERLMPNGLLYVEHCGLHEVVCEEV